MPTDSTIRVMFNWEQCGGKLRWFELGFCFFWATFTIFAHFGPLQQVAPSAYNLSIVVERIALPATVVAIIAISRMRENIVGIRLGPYVAGGAQSIAAILWWTVYQDMAPEFLLHISSLLSGVSTGLFLLLWRYYYGVRHLRRASVLIPASLLISVVIVYFLSLDFVPLQLLFPCLAVLPLLSAFSLKQSFMLIGEGESGRIAPKIGEVVRLLWRPIVCLAIFAMLWQVSIWFGENGEGSGLLAINTLENLGFILALAVLLTAALLSRSMLDVTKIYSLLLPVITALFLILPLAWGLSGPVLSSVLYFGFEMSSVSLIYLCIQKSQEKGWQPHIVYGIALMPEFIALAIGYISGMTFYRWDGLAQTTAFMGVSLAAVYLLCMGYFLVNEARKKRGESISQSDSSKAEESDVSALDPSKSLTKREKEVLEYMIRGYSLPSISSELCISLNTTKGHASNIYAKLGVHSKQELIKMFNQSKSE